MSDMQTRAMALGLARHRAIAHTCTVQEQQNKKGIFMDNIEIIASCTEESAEQTILTASEVEEILLQLIGSR